jgi:hypothetical protein
MRTILISALAALTLGATSAAMAGESRHADRSTRDIAASETIRKGLEDLGYRLSHIEAEHDRLELRAVNDTGLPVKLTYDLATGEMLRAALR